MLVTSRLRARLTLRLAVGHPVDGRPPVRWCDRCGQTEWPCFLVGGLCRMCQARRRDEQRTFLACASADVPWPEASLCESMQHG